MPRQRSDNGAQLTQTDSGGSLSQHDIALTANLKYRVQSLSNLRRTFYWYEGHNKPAVDPVEER